jgi:hypothetical protein
MTKVFPVAGNGFAPAFSRGEKVCVSASVVGEVTKTGTSTTLRPQCSQNGSSSVEKVPQEIHVFMLFGAVEEIGCEVIGVDGISFDLLELLELKLPAVVLD